MEPKVALEIRTVIKEGAVRLTDNPVLTFDPTKCYIPTQGYLTDLFDKDFKLYADFTTPRAAKFFIGITWKGENWLLGTKPVECASYPCSGYITMEWKEGKEMTIQEILEAFGEAIPKETTEYSYTWTGGYLTNATTGVKTTSMDSILLVEVKKFPWLYVIPAVATVAVMTGVIIAVRKK